MKQISAMMRETIWRLVKQYGEQRFRVAAWAGITIDQVREIEVEYDHRAWLKSKGWLDDSQTG